MMIKFSLKDVSAKKDMLCQMVRIASGPLHAKRTGKSGVLVQYHVEVGQKSDMATRTDKTTLK